MYQRKKGECVNRKDLNNDNNGMLSKGNFVHYPPISKTNDRQKKKSLKGGNNL